MSESTTSGRYPLAPASGRPCGACGACKARAEALGA